MGLFGNKYEGMRQRSEVPALLDALAASHGRRDDKIWEALAKLDEPAVPALQRELASGSASRSMAAAFALAALARRSSLPAKKVLRDYLGSSQNPLAAAVAVSALRDEDDATLPGLTDAVLAFLAGPACLLDTPRDPSAYEELPSAMTAREVKDLLRGAHTETRTEQLLAAFTILERSEDLRAVPTLSRALLWRDPVLVEHDEALLASGILEIIPPPFQRDDAHVRAAAAKALGTKDDVSAIPPLLSALRDDALEVRIAASHSLTSVVLMTGSSGALALDALKQLVLVPDPIFPHDVDDPRHAFAAQHAEVRAAACLNIRFLIYVDGGATLRELQGSGNALIRRAADEGVRRWAEVGRQVHGNCASE